MIVFWLVAAALSALVLLFIVPPLIATPASRAVDQQTQNVAIARQRLAELDKAREDGALDEEDYQEGRRELEQALALDIAQLDSARNAGAAVRERSSAAALMLPVVLAFAIPATAGTIYLLVGQPAAVGGVPVQGGQAGAGAPGQPSIEEMIDQLKERLAQNPDDARGWSILARTSMRLERYDDAVLAYDRLNALTPGDADVLVQYADALAMQSGGRLEGRATELLREALDLQPDHPQALWLAGMAAEARGEYAAALAHWTRLLPQLAEEPETRSRLESMIDDLEGRAEAQGVALEAPPVAPALTASATDARQDEPPSDANLTVKVSLAPELAASTAPDDTVFVFARAEEGPPMPVAAARRRVGDLPFEVVLDDSRAMVPDIKLSSFDRVDVIARVSRSGQPVAASGDLEGLVESVSTGAGAELELVINRRVP